MLGQDPPKIATLNGCFVLGSKGEAITVSQVRKLAGEVEGATKERRR